MQTNPLTAAALAALLLATSATAAAAQLQRGTVEIGGFGQYTAFDDRLNLEDAIGAGMRLGVFLSPRWALEFDFGRSAAEPASQTFQPGGVPVSCPNITDCPDEWDFTPIYLRVAYNVPVGSRSQFLLGLHGTRLGYEFDHEYGAGALIGLRAGISRVLAFRLDGLVDWNRFDEETPSGDDTDVTLTARAGVSLMIGGQREAPPPPPPVVAPTPAPAPAPAPPPVDQDSIARARADSIAAAERMTAMVRATMAEAIYFDFDQSTLRDSARAALDRKVPLFQANPSMRIRISGHADERGSDEYNVALGQRRAAAAKDYLVQRGIDANRIDIVSYGEERPVCEANTEECYQRNRRDEFEIIAGGPSFVMPNL